MISGREYAKIAENIKKSSFPERASQLPAAVLRFVALILGCGFIGLAAAGIAAKLPLLLVLTGMVFGLMWLTAALLLHISYRWTIERWMLKNALEKVDAAKNLELKVSFMGESNDTELTVFKSGLKWYVAF